MPEIGEIVHKDGKDWLWDHKHKVWINVSVDNPKLRKLLDEAVPI
jgi:hypothetical protein